MGGVRLEENLLTLAPSHRRAFICRHPEFACRYVELGWRKPKPGQQRHRLSRATCAPRPVPSSHRLCDVKMKSRHFVHAGGGVPEQEIHSLTKLSDTVRLNAPRRPLYAACYRSCVVARGLWGRVGTYTSVTTQKGRIRCAGKTFVLYASEWQ